MFSDEAEEDDLGYEAQSPQQSQPSRRTFASEFDDFIEDDEFSDDQNMEESQPSRRSEKLTRGPEALALQYKGLDEDKLQELYEVFGDGEEYEWALEGEDDLEQMGYSSEDGEKAGPDLKDVFEPGELKNKLLTDEDNAIRAKDVPERYQLLRANFKDDYDLTDEEFEQEVQWITQKLSQEKSKLFAAKPHLRAPFKKAVQSVVEFICKENLEVPFIWLHRKDFLVYVRPNAEGQSSSSGPVTDLLLTIDNLWRIVHLDIEFHGILLKSKACEKLYNSLGIYDDTYLEMFRNASSFSDYQDLFDYLHFNYSSKIKENINSTAEKSRGTYKRPSHFSRFDRIRNGPIYPFLKSYGITAQNFGANVSSAARIYFTEDHPTAPLELAEQYVGTTPEGKPSAYKSAQHVLDDAQAMFAEEIYYEPRVRKFLRDAFWKNAKVDIIVTEKGRKQIDEESPYADIKYAINRSFDDLRLRPELYLRMLNAENEGLVIVRISYPNYKNTLFETLFSKYLASDNVSDIAKAWNESRRAAFKATSQKIIPHICGNIKEDLRTECIRSLYYEIREQFAKRLDQAPFKPYGYAAGTTPRVLTLSWGSGQSGKDAVLATVLNEEGKLIEVAKLEDPRNPAFKTNFVALVRKRVPDVVGVAGFTVSSKQLFQEIADIIKAEDLTSGSDVESTVPLDLIWVQDEVAHLFKNTQRAIEEFPDQVTLSRYCIALARYVQSPLLEYASLEDMTSIRVHPYQRYLPVETFNEAIETVFVDYVNMVGVDINEAIRNPYIANVVKYVAGLGPRKASSILHGIQSHGGSLTNRAELVTNNITGKSIFMNCSSFFIIPYNERTISNEATDILDATRIHPQDYYIARKMATDALELDEEDVEAYDSQGGVVAQLINEDVEKLNELILEEYANELEREYNKKKRETLEMIKSEIQRHFGEKRSPFHILTEMEVFTMLTGETKDTLHNGVIVPFNIKRVNNQFLSGVLSCGVEGTVSLADMFDPGAEAPHPSTAFSILQTVQTVILDIDYSKFVAKLSTAESRIKEAREQRKKTQRKDPNYWNIAAEEAEKMRLAQKKEEERRATRVIKHPLFKPFNSRQAEDYLATMSRGDCVIRPSSRGDDHIAITWKVADGIFQHVDVLELDKPNQFSIGNVLQVGNLRFSDLDELIITYIQAIARKIQQMVNHEKFFQKPKSEVEEWLKAYTRSNPKRSVYAFCFDHKRAGYISLMFQTGQGSPIQTWSVKVIPGGYSLLKHEYPDVISLINGFKQIMKQLSTQNQQQQHRAPPPSHNNNNYYRNNGGPPPPMYSNDGRGGGRGYPPSGPPGGYRDRERDRYPGGRDPGRDPRREVYYRR